KSAARTRLDALKERRAELRKTYVKARYDELKSDVRAEANRVAAWTKRTFSRADDKVRDATAEVRADTREATADAKRSLDRAGDRTHAALASTAASMDLAAYKLRPTDTNKDEARAALKALDAQIEALEDRVDAMPSGATRDAAERRVKALEDRKDDLQGEFNKARFDALVDEVQAEWKNLK
ncbi:MAG TPA: hypothetical protein VEQ65_11750, partial [Opitutus sp.]|nr:hypothetical protein [Opitutus sp.]